MKRNLQQALIHLHRARPFLRRALSKRHYPMMHEDLDYLIHNCKDLLATLARGETLPH